MDGGITKGANRYLNINLVAPPKCRGMNGPRTSSKDDILGPFSSRAHSSNVDISMSRLCTRSDSHDSQDAQSLHSSVCQSFDNVTSVVARASSTGLAEFDPYTGFPSTHNNDAELCCPTTEVERPMAETDTECHGSSPTVVETEEEQ